MTSKKNVITQKQLFIILCEKGGVGKSTFAKAFTDFKRRGPQFDDSGALKLGADNQPICVKRNVLVVDCNPKVGQLADSYGLKNNGVYDPKANALKPFEGVLTLDIKDKTQATKLVDYIDMNPDDIIMDKPGGSITDVSAVFGTVDAFIDEYQKEGYQVIVINVIDHLLPSAKNVAPAMQAWQKADKFVVVKNLGKAQENMFTFFDGEFAVRAGKPAELVKERGGIIINMPKMEDDTYALFDAEQMSFSAGGNPETSPLNRAHRGRLRNFMKQCDAEIAKMKCA